MKRAVIYFITGGLAASSALAQLAPSPLPAAELINIINGFNSAPNPPYCNTSEGLQTYSPDADLRFASLVAPTFNRASCNHFNADSFCNSLPPITSAWAMDRAVQLKRQNNEALKRRVFSHLKAYFENLITDPEVLEACCSAAEPAVRCGELCAQNRSCQQRLAQTKLQIIPSTAPDEQTQRYDFNAHSVVLSESRVLNSFQPETNEQILLHELGHSCQFSRPRLADNRRALANASPTDDSEAWSDLQARVPEVAKCLRDGIVRAADEWRGPQGETARRSNWAMEIFADTIFAFRRQNPHAWSWECAATPNVEHAPIRLEMNCIFPSALPATVTPHAPLWSQYCQQHAAPEVPSLQPEVDVFSAPL